MTARVTQAADRAQSSVRAAVEQPGTENTRKAAEAIIGLRRQFKHEGLPDWAGRSAAYRDMIERVYRDADVPSDTQDGFQANLRYHIGNCLRKIAPPEQLQALGLQTEGPLGRVRQARKESGGTTATRRRRVTTLGDPVSMADAAIGIVAALGTMQIDGASDDLEPRLRALIDEALTVITNLPH